MPDTLKHLTLPNGLHLTLRHAPRLKRAAVALRVHAGSHDAPARWPGLAHFLEHLFFLGTPRFPMEDGLMRYVQTLGGQVNASTRERTTDYFFEVPPAALAGALERLCQMLAEPDLGLARQRREREVIHAEFIAWSRNPEAQQQFALLQAVSPRHPLSAFHAGNRHSLVLGNPAFQQALVHFHQGFYHGGQITLSLAGPQPLEHLQQLGRQFGALFGKGQRAEQQAPPPLLDGPLLPAQGDDLLFAHDGLPAGAEQALGLLLSHLTDTRAGSWLAELRQRGWLRDCKVQLLHAHAGQLLWHLKLQLAEAANRNQAHALLYSWLGFLRRQDRQRLNHSYARLQQRQEQTASALELARRDSTGQTFDGLGAQCLAALDALLDDLPHTPSGHWQLPVDDPLLDNTLGPAAAPLPPGMTVSEAVPASRQFAALHLRWQVSSPLRVRFWPILERALQPLQARAERASLQLGLNCAGEYWHLRIAGQPEPAIKAVNEALALLHCPAAEHWHAPLAAEPPLIPLRALLKALPGALQAVGDHPQPACLLDHPLLESLWQHARWQGLASGFDSSQLGALGAALQDIVSQPDELAPPPPLQGMHWKQVDTSASEAALLLFCPLPEALQPAGRLLAHLMQGPVYQRLRVELQLGYAVFSAFRQVEGVGGLLFGVQSPNASHQQILDHLLGLLHEGVQLNASARRQLAEQFDEATMTNAEVSEWLWQAYIAKHNSDLSYIRWSILSAEQHALDDLLQQLISARHGWLCLANTAAPDARWR
ncbi:pyrroloquinoline quinone biosynthesis protein PqqF [Pseudomonas fakonensis]|uniref:Pyrroloquinoline quinone biosynthesis protein PqqF n=1 Tax=Pseudomonas fakonensis TaxID=2842355 RepID=A0ABX8N810_9PSED|nr:pyrroloquinoline quinone biosynthesis protein PqqF [Pseudomonas fakonensis]QXH51975.1 pyrroloquinoline quinone biosynthesis protein PqqF [Pseudomonas fakonensis]